MAGPTYKIRIIKTGIGDRLAVGNFQFEDDDEFSNPSTDPVVGLQIQFAFKLNNGEFVNLASMTYSQEIAGRKIGNEANPSYVFSFPFDIGSGYESGDAIQIKLTFSCTNGEIWMEDSESNSAVYAPTFTSTPSSYSTIYTFYKWMADQ